MGLLDGLMSFTMSDEMINIGAREMNQVENLHPQYITNEDGNKTAVVIPIREFDALMEDMADLAAVVERVNETTTSHQDLVEELKNDGLL